MDFKKFEAAYKAETEEKREQMLEEFYKHFPTSQQETQNLPNFDMQQFCAMLEEFRELVDLCKFKLLVQNFGHEKAELPILAYAILNSFEPKNPDSPSIH